MVQRLLEKFQVFLREPSVLSQRGIQETVAAIETVRDSELAPDSALAISILLVGHSATGDGEFSRDNGIEAAGKGELDGAAYLAAIYLSRHHSTEGADVVEVVAHPFGDLTGLLLILGKLF